MRKTIRQEAKKEQKGITLIALVITIIVLLILAGVAITMLTEDNSILKQAGNAKTKTEFAKAQEELTIAYAGEVTEKIANNSKDDISIKNVLDRMGYEYEEGAGSTDNVTGLKITEDAEGTKEITGSFKIAQEATETVYVKKVENNNTEDGEKTYYVKVDGKYHKVVQTTNSIELEERAATREEVTGGGTSEYEVIVISSDTNKQYVEVEYNEETGEITIIATDEEPSTAITITAQYVNKNDSSDVKCRVALNANVEIKIAEATGTKPYLPAKATITNNNLATGLTIIDENDNEWVWIEVPNDGEEAQKGKTWVNYSNVAALQESDITGKTEAYYEAIYNDLRNYCTIDKDGNSFITIGANNSAGAKTTTRSWTDEWYAKDGTKLVTKNTSGLTDAKKGLKNGCGLDYTTYYQKKKAMLESIYTNGGFYIGKYETGYKTGNKRETGSADTTIDDLKNINKPLIQVDAYPYNWVTCSQAEGLAETLATGGKNSTLMFGIQWDLVLKHLNVKRAKTTLELTSNSSAWGNYSGLAITITNNNAQISTASPYNSFSSATNTSGLLTTGASSDAGALNIYDLAGNVVELTLEKTASSGNPCAKRGGNFGDSGSFVPASYRSIYNTTSANYDHGFRCTLY